VTIKYRLIPYAIPFRRPIATSRGVYRTRRGYWIVAMDEEGNSGYGEAAPLPEEMTRVITDLEGRRRSGVDVARIIRSSPIVRIGAEVARMDLECRREGKRLADAFSRSPLPAVACNLLLTETDPNKAAEEAAQAVAHGYETLKLKVGSVSYTKDERRVAAVREAVGPAVRLRLDANRRWPLETALLAIRRFERYGIEYIEEPIDGDIAYLRADSPIPIAADESIRGITDARRLIRSGGAHLIVLKPMAIGLRAAFAIAREARNEGIGVVVTSALDTPVGIAAALHLACALPDEGRAHGLATATNLGPNPVRGLAVPIRGMMRLPASPGLGVEILWGTTS
jgi:L-Ala-D/L-Glu epimerase